MRLSRPQSAVHPSRSSQIKREAMCVCMQDICECTVHPPTSYVCSKAHFTRRKEISHTHKGFGLRDGKRCFSSRPVTRKCTTRGLAKTEEWKIHVHSEDLGGEHSRKRTLASWNVTASTSSWRSPWYPAASSRQHAESDKVHMCRGSTRCLRNVSAHLKLTRR